MQIIFYLFLTTTTTFLLLFIITSTVADEEKQQQQQQQQHGHEFVVEMDWPMQRTYSLEDFLWTGSGDGPGSDVLWVTTTVMHTKTVYPTPVFPSTSFIPEISPTPTIPFEYSSTTTTELPVTQQQHNDTTTTTIPDQRYWLVTVIKTNVTDELYIYEFRLSKLYHMAFTRQQQMHLGLGNGTTPVALLRLRRDTSPDSVHVHVHNTTQNRPQELDIVYSVAVDGRPVLALVAAHDMQLITEKEMVDQLGYPVLTKAEPYLGSALALSGKNDPQIGRRRDTWLLVGAAVAGVGILLILLALLTLALAKRKRRILTEAHRRPPSIRPGVNVLGGTGAVNQGFITDEEAHQGTSDFTAAVTTRGEGQGGSVSSGESPPQMLVRRRPQGPRPRPRKRNIVQTTDVATPTATSHQRNLDGNEGTSGQTGTGTRETLDTVDEVPPQPQRRGSVISPYSFLSMPSVKSFQGANIPEPLSRVLEPVSVSHLDCEDEDDPIVAPMPLVKKKLTRHASLEGDDPGVLGPLVWDTHRSSLGPSAEHQVKVSMGPDMEVNDANFQQQQQVTSHPGNVSRMRKRFNELLDDAFSLFGSQRSDADGDVSTSSPTMLPPVDFRDAARPHTCEAPPRRPATAAGVSSRSVRGAWGSNNELPPTPPFAPKSLLSKSMMPRPLSAGPFHKPCFPPELRIYEEPTTTTTTTIVDPAGPLIAAIKQELERFPKEHTGHLPGSAKN